MLYGILLVLSRCCFHHLVENSILYKKDIQHFYIGPILFSEDKIIRSVVSGKVDGQILFDTRSEKRKNLFGTKWQLRKILFGSQRVNGTIYSSIFFSWINYQTLTCQQWTTSSPYKSFTPSEVQTHWEIKFSSLCPESACYWRLYPLHNAVHLMPTCSQLTNGNNCRKCTRIFRPVLSLVRVKNYHVVNITHWSIHLIETANCQSPNYWSTSKQ